jgi:hypothetical protein
MRQTAASAMTTAYVLPFGIKGSLRRAAPALDPDQQRWPRKERQMIKHRNSG